MVLCERIPARLGKSPWSGKKDCARPSLSFLHPSRITLLLIQTPIHPARESLLRSLESPQHSRSILVDTLLYYIRKPIFSSRQARCLGLGCGGFPVCTAGSIL
jgi:hypothetical protein